jgi:hypothetical protein
VNGTVVNVVAGFYDKNDQLMETAQATITMAGAGQVTLNSGATVVVDPGSSCGSKAKVRSAPGILGTVGSSRARAVMVANGVETASAWFGTPGLISVSSITRSGSTASVTTAVNHGRSNGDWVFIQGANQAEYNGLFQITVTGAATFDYTVTGTPATPATGTIFESVNVVTTLTDFQVSGSGIIRQHWFRVELDQGSGTVIDVFAPENFGGFPIALECSGSCP